MKRTTLIFLIIIVIISALLIFLHVGNINSKNKPYKELEDNIVLAMKKYYGQDVNLKKLPSNNEKVKISIKELKDFGIEINTKIDNDNCDGYGIVTGLNISHKYEAYLKCDNYTTKNYENYK